MKSETGMILDLCAGTGAWSQPYSDASYQVLRVDNDRQLAGGARFSNADVRDFMPPKVHGVLAAPPCTEFAGSGAKWWSTKGHWRLHDALSVVDACIRVIFISKPDWWCLENPVGLLSHYLGEPDLVFDPCDYGDPYTKRTCLWGKFNIPKKSPVEPTEGSKIHLYSPSPGRAALRAITPPGFAKAFFEANP